MRLKLRSALWCVCAALLAFPQTANSETAAPNKCKDMSCVDLRLVAANLKARLDGKAVGYSYALIQGDEVVEGGGGFARTAADGGELAFSPETPIIIASVSKLVTTIATMALF